MAQVSSNVVPANAPLPYWANSAINGAPAVNAPFTSSTSYGATTPAQSALTSAKSSSPPVSSAPATPIVQNSTITRTASPAPVQTYNPGTPQNSPSYTAPSSQPTSLVSPSTGYQPTGTTPLVNTSNLSASAPTYSGAVGALANTSGSTNPNTQAASTGLISLNQSNPGNSGPAYDTYNTARQNLLNYQNQLAQLQVSDASQGMPGYYVQGRQGIENAANATKLAALQEAVTSAGNALNTQVSGQGVQNTGLSSAGGLGNTTQSNQITGQNAVVGATAPQLGQYGSTYYNPQTGGSNTNATPSSPTSGQASGMIQQINQAVAAYQAANPGKPLPQALQDEISSVESNIASSAQGGSSGTSSLNPINNLQSIAQQVVNGQISPSQGYALGGSVANFQGALNQAIQQASPGFDTAKAQGAYDAKLASETQTGTTGGQVKKAADAALPAIDAVQSAYDALGKYSKGGDSGIPLLSEIAQNSALQTGSGRVAVSNYRGALAEARAKIDSVLAPSIGVDAASAQASNLLPENMLPAEIPGKISAAKNYINQFVAAQTGNPVPSNISPGNSGGSSIYDF